MVVEPLPRSAAPTGYRELVPMFVECLVSLSTFLPSAPAGIVGARDPMSPG